MSADESSGGGEDTGASTPKKKKGVPMVAVVAGLMIAEAGVVFGVMSMLSAPDKSKATTIAGDSHAADEALVEIPLVEDRFQNMQTGRVWIWDVAVYLKVKAKHEAHVTHVLQARSAEVKEGISMIFRRASHAQLKEPGLETLNRQIAAYTNEIVGADPDGNPYINRILMPRCKGLQID